MPSLRRGIAASLVVVIVILVLAVGTIGFVALEGSSISSSSAIASSSSSSATTSNGSTSTTTVSTGTDRSASEFASVESEQGLQLRLSLDQSQVYVGGTILVNVSEFNSLDRPNNITKSGDWVVSAALGSCPNTDVQPYGIALYQGHYTAQNVSEGSQIQIFPITACPMFVRLISGYVFQPNSSAAVILPGNASSPMSSVVAIGNETIGFGQVVALGPGSYTMAAADEWGAVVFLYFQVLSPPGSPAASSITSST